MKRQKTKLYGAAGFFFTALVVSLALLLYFNADTSLGEEENRKTVSAHIDEECKSHPQSFEIEAGKTAKDFISEDFEEGTSCHGEGKPENMGFAIRDSHNKPVYMWSKYKDNEPYEKGGPLGSLSLGPGNYTLSVAGGAGAEVSLSYVLE